MSPIAPSPHSFLLVCLSFICLLVFSEAATFQHTPPWKPAHGSLSPARLRALGTAARDLDQAVADDLELMLARRVEVIVGGVTNGRSISTWLSSLGEDGKWPDDEIDYATQCAARRANWPAQVHWSRILTMAAGYHGGLDNAAEWVGSTPLREAISLAMKWWFDRDFLNEDCQDAGGTEYCPCSDPPTPSSWMFNTNWFSNVLFADNFPFFPSCEDRSFSYPVTSAESYANFERNSPVRPPNWLTGANTLDVASIGIDGAIVSRNVEQLADAYRRVHLQANIIHETSADGIRPDGAFGQHIGLLYNGNYGKDYLNAVLGLEYAAAGTEYQADDVAQSSMVTLLDDGGRWMIYRNTLTGVLHWDFSALPRFITFPVVDNQATGSIKTNLSAIEVLGQLWNSEPLVDFAQSLSLVSDSSNAGNRLGNRMFYTNDYMVHRGKNYVSTLKMISSRSKTSECINSQNPLGFHLSDGTLYTYVSGNEYEDIAAAWDWSLIPGTTTDYGNTPLSCDQTEKFGVEPMVGGVSDGKTGIAAMRYTNPLTEALSFQKAWFFLEDDIQHVVVSSVSSQSTAPVVSVLDQKRLSGDVYFKNDGHNKRNPVLWHANVGYSISDPSESFIVQQVVEQRTGDWSAIGTSDEPPATVDFFTAFVNHTSLDQTLSYTAYPGIDLESFQRKVDHHSPDAVVPIESSGAVTAIYDKARCVAMIVFWDAEGGSVQYRSKRGGIRQPFTISSDKASAILYSPQSRQVTVSDPTQTADSLSITVSTRHASETISFELPTRGDRGKSVTAILTKIT